MRAWLVGVLVLTAAAAWAAGPGEVAWVGEGSLRLSGDLRGLDLYDGRARAGVKLVADGKSWKTADGKLLVALRTETLKDRTNWRVEIANRGAESAWLLVRGFAGCKAVPGAEYFNGNFASPVQRAVVRDRLAWTMPFVGVYGAETPALRRGAGATGEPPVLLGRGEGVGLGIEPSQIFSYIENGVVPGQGEHSFYYGVKVVVDPGKTATIHFVTFPLAVGRWGERGAVACYQALYPAAFAPIPDGDPRLQVKGEAGSAPTWYKPSPEAVRRTMSGCDWCYAPVKIPGDWYGRPEFWDKYNENVDAKKLETRYGTLDHWHGLLRETFNRVDCDNRVAPYFYIINWTYYKLAEEYYPDAMVTDPKAQNRIGPWVTNKGPDVRVLLWGNKHAEQYHQDLRDLWANYSLSGFGHDVAMGEVKYRGPAVAVSPGRAWDEEGEYCDVSVCIAKTGDFVHELPKKQYRAGFWGNGSDHIYSIAVRSDASSFEGARYMLPGMDDKARYQRYIMGSKAIQLFSGDSRDNTTNYYDEEKTPLPEIKEMYRRIEVSSLQFCVKWGVLPCADMGWGWQEGWELKKLADRELFPYPWQLRPQAWVEGPIDLAQYGTGAQARFALVNSRGVPAEATVRVNLPAAERVLYALADGQETVNRVGREVEVKVSVPAAGVVVLLPVVVGTRAGEYTVARVNDEVDGLRVVVKGGAEGLRVVVPDGYEVAKDSPWHLSRKIFVAEEKALLDFWGTAAEMSGAGGAQAPSLEQTVILAPGKSVAERKAAEALQEYFRYYSEEVLGKPRVVLPIVAEAPAGRKVVRVTVGATPTVGLDAAAECLTIQAPPEALLDTARELLRLLDRRFPYYGQIGRWVHQRPIETKLRQTLGIAGGTVLRDGTVLMTPQTASLWNQVERGLAYGKPW